MSLSPSEAEHAASQLVSLSGTPNIKEALAKWYCSDHCYDYGQPITTCQLTGIEGYRFLFEITHDTRDISLWASLECVLALRLPVIRQGETLSAPRARAELERAIWMKRRESCVVALMEYGMATLDHRLLRAIAVFRDKEALSPKDADLVFSVLEREKIDHEPGFFRVFLRRRQDRMDIMNMAPWQVWRFWGALTPSQQQEVKQLGHNPPPAYAQKTKAQSSRALAQRKSDHSPARFVHRVISNALS